MKIRSSWRPILLSVMLYAPLGTPLYSGVDDTAALSSVNLNGIELIMVPLTETDVVIGQDVDFEVTIRNTSASPTRCWLWFTVNFPKQTHEKMVSSPYLSKESPFSGALPAYGEAVLQLSVRPLNELQVGFYTFIAKVGPYVIPFDGVWVSAMSSFNGYVSGDTTVGRAPDEDWGELVITSIRAVNEAGRTFLEEIGKSMPRAVNIVQNYPNPFNPSTNITFEVNTVDGMKAPVNLTVYTVRGRMIRSLVDENKSPGIYTVRWDGKDERGLTVESGIYLFRLQSGKDVSIRKGVMTK